MILYLCPSYKHFTSLVDPHNSAGPSRLLYGSVDRPLECAEAAATFFSYFAVNASDITVLVSAFLTELISTVSGKLIRIADGVTITCVRNLLLFVFMQRVT